MALSNICEAVVERLRLIPGFVQAPDTPPPALTEDRILLVYPRPGDTTPFAHSGSFGKVVYQARDSVIVEWHLRKAADQIALFLELGIPLLDSVRDTCWSEFARNRFGKTIDALYSVNTDHFGEMGWSTDFTWGFRVVLDVMHGNEVQA